MSYCPGNVLPVPPMVSPLTLGWSAIALESVLPTAPTSSGYEISNRAIYFPVLVAAPCIARRLWWANGSTVSASNNIDCGIYSDAGYKPGAKIVSTGSTSQGTASEVQFVDISDTALAPGRYWLAIAVSNTAATFFRSAATNSYEAALGFQEASALPLPTTATPEERNATGVYLFGFATTASP